MSTLSIASFAVKKYIVPILIGSVIALLGASHTLVYQKGKSSERAAHELAKTRAVLRAVEESERIRIRDFEILMGARQRETIITERLKTVYVDVPTPDCVDLGNDWLQEYNRALSAANP
jgi:tRNA G37 N-methylase Trm5